LASALLAFAPTGLALAFRYRKVSSRQSVAFSIDQCLVFSVEKYRPMERLLQEADFRFLAVQRGFSPQMGRRFRVERRRLFRGYLRNLKKDFGRVSLACQMLIVHSAEDRADLAKGLLRQRLLFALGMLAIEARLLLHFAGIGTVEVRGLVESLGTMQAQLRLQLMPYQAVMATG
jgi:hypothetical protein